MNKSIKNGNYKLHNNNPVGNDFADSKPRVAIIGGGISGLTSAYNLHLDCEVTLFESEEKLGGHTDTHEFNIDDSLIRIDSGFIIFCPEYYPNFAAMLKELGVESQATDMSFSARNNVTGTIYNATNPNKLFCDRSNLFRPRFWRMVLDILRFYRQAKKLLVAEPNQTMSVAEYLKVNGYSKQFSEDHLLPMISALWSATPERVNQFPIYHLVDFFERHGLMKIFGRPQWLVVKNGSASYVEALQTKLNCEWRIGEPVIEVRRSEGGAVVKTASEESQFDAVVFATHADVTLKLLTDASSVESEVLAAIPFEKNHVVVHTDESLMHENPLSWASWNTVVPHDCDQNSLECCTANYWMNSLQGLNLKTNVFTTLNSTEQINPEAILAERYYSHPIFTAESVAAQKRLPEINGVNRAYFTGAYWGWGFHEDGARSAVQACKLLREAFKQKQAQSQLDGGLQ
ncbi:MAG: FAD-dependent oxidoreductase [Gammaproteobacteria bacterium]|nr:FAD-dependent oxidoreductase [Gammaproteobacteria bacterium]